MKYLMTMILILGLVFTACDTNLVEEDHDHDGDGIEDHAPEDHEEDHEEDNHTDEETAGTK